jgi:hypothetical protein
VPAGCRSNARTPLLCSTHQSQQCRLGLPPSTPYVLHADAATAVQQRTVRPGTTGLQADTSMAQQVGAWNATQGAWWATRTCMSLHQSLVLLMPCSAVGTSTTASGAPCGLSVIRTFCRAMSVHWRTVHTCTFALHVVRCRYLFATMAILSRDPPISASPSSPRKTTTGQKGLASQEQRQHQQQELQGQGRRPQSNTTQAQPQLQHQQLSSTAAPLLPQHVSNIGWALAKLGVRPPVWWRTVFEQALNAQVSMLLCYQWRLHVFFICHTG